MYVDRSVCSLEKCYVLIEFLKERKRLCNSSYGANAHSGFRLYSIHGEQERIEARLSILSARVAEMDSSESQYHKLCSNLNSGIKKYLIANQTHSVQRDLAIKRIKSIMQNLQQDQSLVATKLAELVVVIVDELNKAEVDHNKSFFSSCFTTSGFAEMLMEVLRNNCIDPNNLPQQVSVEMQMKKLT
jgi:hypothetical protein